MQPPKISIFSNPLVSTWVFDETHRILFDAGDGVSAMLDGKIHRANYLALTHSHRDHCAGLMQFLNLRGGAGDFNAIYPVGSGSARTLETFLTAFDSRSTSKVRWSQIAAGESFQIAPERYFLRAFETDHYPFVEGLTNRSLGYQIVRTVDKLKPEFRSMPQAQVDEIRRAKGRECMLETIEDILFTITGDTLPLSPEIFKGSRVLMHEATFMDRQERDELINRGNPHCCLEEALIAAQLANVGRLGLYHISRRYDDEQIVSAVKEWCERLEIKFPVSVAFPGRLIENLFANEVWSPG